MMDRSSSDFIDLGTRLDEFGSRGKFKVDLVSSRYSSDGVAQQMTAMRAFPDSDGCRMRVNLSRES
jgi:hypothetical protein